MGFFLTPILSRQISARYNPLGIKMLPKQLYEQVFGPNEDPDRAHDPQEIERCLTHLRKHDLYYPEDCQTKHELDIMMKIPKLEGENINQHFLNLGKRYSSNYKHLADQICDKRLKISEFMPKIWATTAGWTRYVLEDGEYVASSVDSPCENVLIFDVETCIIERPKHSPTIAVAMSDKAWYSWCSPKLSDLMTKQHYQEDEILSTKHLIEFSSRSNEERLIIGHNVGFDRTFLRSQYELLQDMTRFIDTLSLHMCICGLTGLQRAVKMAQKKKVKNDEPVETGEIGWIEEGSLNNLADVYKFHCGGELRKDEREVFVKGNLKDVAHNYESLMTYCARDVQATYEVFCKLFREFSNRFPHPVTLAGMLEMSTMYLPVRINNWQNYIAQSQNTYDEHEKKLNLSLQDLANKACSMPPEQWKKDIWLWDLDWSTQDIRVNKTKFAAWKRAQLKSSNRQKLLPENTYDQIQTSSHLDDEVDLIYKTKSFMRSIMPHMPGFPRWYRDLCLPANHSLVVTGEKKWEPGPFLISTQMRITSKLVRLMWDGYPLHHHPKYGWGYLVPNDDLVTEYLSIPDNHPYRNFPYETLKELCKDLPRDHVILETGGDNDDNIRKQIETLQENSQMDTITLMRMLKRLSGKKRISPKFKNEFCEDVHIPGALFFRLPHKNGPSFNVGNPLARDFLRKVEDGTLTAYNSEIADTVLRCGTTLSYWKNNQKRIKDQMVVSFEGDKNNQGAILPRVIVAGTVTRRAVEPTWLTASNIDNTRIGSELKAMIQAPEDFCFVGADVDSQELWIASLIGDSYSCKIHGGTGLSYMTLRGSKINKTDMHSKTASLIGISRSHAKVLNYARIYGAGQKFVERFLMQTNHRLTPSEAQAKAKKIFSETKGVRKPRRLYYSIHTRGENISGDMDPNIILARDRNISIALDVPRASPNDIKDEPVITPYQSSLHESDLRYGTGQVWVGGTESATFNKLEEIASASEPRTPILECQISRALEPMHDQAKDFMTSRVNWVVQSSAVDFLHLILVSMKWFFEKFHIEGRFSISIHDEVRYIVRSDDRYKAAYALQLSNLLVRAYFAYRLNMKDLPISVAFFTSVDIDSVLRKEVDLDCQSPSNPFGLRKGYGIPSGESLDIKEILEKLDNEQQKHESMTHD